jgi:hypothetical protein
MGSMKYQRGYVTLSHDGNETVLLDGEMTYNGGLKLTPEDLRWLCTTAGPALLNELGKEATRGND